MEDWTCQHDKHEVMQLLQQAGVASAPVLPCSEIVSDPHIEHRGFCEEIVHPVTGTQRYHGFPVKFSETPVRTRMPAPTLGQHNYYILTNVLGMKEEEIEQLVKEEIIGTMPKGWPYLAEGEDETAKDKKFLVTDHGSGVTAALEKQKDIDAKENGSDKDA
ncbi:MAG: CoA transferase [Dehalococcoidia bacterium]|nr:MAG: CoA transferase [Dehalococcoidia bacterium]